VLKGRLQETLFDWPDKTAINNGLESPPKVKRETIYRENEVTYMSDTLGLHKVSNPDPDEIAVSLHLYTPPNAAVYGCHTFDPSTGKAVHVKQCNFFSDRGQRI